METSIIILNFNGKQYLQACIDSVLAQRYRDFEIVFVDNASSDGSVGFVRERYAAAIRERRLRIVRNSKNHGFAQGNNIGLRHARGRYVVLLNTDIKAKPDWLGELVKTMLYPDVRCAGTFYYEPGGQKEFERHLAGRTNGMNLCTEHMPLARKTLHEKHLLDVFFVSGNGVIVRRSEYRQLFDPDYFAYAEDTYMGWLAHLQGKQVVLNAKARMEHVGGGVKKGSSRRFSSFLEFHGTKNQMMNILLFYEWKNVLKVLPLLAMTQLAHIAIRPRKLLSTIRAKWWILTHFRSILAKRKAIQKTREVSDSELLRRISGKFFDEREASRRGIAFRSIVRSMNALFLCYCWIMRLKTAEFP
jgi:GT2 family glycosyltransferase